MLPKFSQAVVTASKSNILSTTHSTVLEAVESIQIPYDGIADPNKILGQSAKRNLADRLRQHSTYLTVNGQGRVVATSTRNQNSNDAKDSKQSIADIDNAEFPVQIAVAVVEGIGIWNDDIDCENDVDIEEIAGQFATSLHNKWGIGQEIIPIDKDDSTENNSGGGTGVLVFLSVRDRVVFISVGGALGHLLTSGRIDRIIHNAMRPDLKQANYELGLTKGIDAIIELLKKAEEPSVFERSRDKWFNTNTIVVFIWTIFVIGNGAFQRWKRQREQRIYAKAAIRLSELDRARAEALRGTYRRTASCPICLDDFSSTVLGSDGHPIQLLRCGHVFDKTCYQEWVSSGCCGDVTKCPMCRADVGFSLDDIPDTLSTGNNIQFRSFAANAGSEDDDDPNDGSSTNNNDLQSIVTNHDGVTFAFEDDNGNDSTNLTGSSFDRDTHMMNLYQRDRNYRLERLSELYPRYITSDAVMRWSSPTFNGSLVRDLSFRNRDPAVTQNVRRCCSSASDSEHGLNNGNDQRGGCTFNGGTSAGGKGGRF